MDALVSSLQRLPLAQGDRQKVAATGMALGAALTALLFARVLAWWIRGVVRWLRVGLGTRSVPRAPGGGFFLGHALQLARAPCPWERMLEWARATGPIVRFNILQRTGLIVNDPQGAKRVFQTKQRLYEKDLDFSYKPFLESILGTGLVTANGAQWQKQRQLMAPALRIDMLDAIIPIAKHAVERLCKQLESYRGTSTPVDLEEEFRLLTLQVIGEAILSLPPDECDRVFPHLYLPVMEENNLRVLAPWRRFYPLTSWRYNSRVTKLNDYIIGIIRARRATRAASGGKPPVKPDILDRVLLAGEESGEKWTAASEVQLCYEIKTFLLAGHETSSAMLCWSFYELSQNREVLDKVRAEAAAVFPGTGEGVPSREAVDGMDYSLAVLKEALRKYSVVPVVTRDLVQDDELLGHAVPRGSWLIIHIQGIHQQYQEPAAFRPDRFMPGGEYDAFPEDIRPYMFLPFIQGPRNCLGQYFALLEARVVLAVLAKRFTFTAVDAKGSGETHPTVIPVAPRNGMKMLVS